MTDQFHKAVAAEMEEANIPHSALTTTLRREGSLAASKWVFDRKYRAGEEDPDPERFHGLILVPERTTYAKHRRMYNRLAAEMCLMGEGVRVIDPLTLAVQIRHPDSGWQENWRENEIRHLFLDHFYMGDEEICPLSSDHRYLIKLFCTGWMERGNALYPFVDVADLSRAEGWWGPTFCSSIFDDHVDRVNLKGR